MEALKLLETTEKVLVYCNIVNNDHQKNSIVLYTFIPDDKFGQLLDIHQEKVIFLKTFDSEFRYIAVSFTGQNYKALEIEEKLKITLVINLGMKYKIFSFTQFSQEIKYL